MRAEEAENWFKAEFGGDWDEQCHARFAAVIEQAVSEARIEEAECIFTNWNVDESIRSFEEWHKHHIAALHAKAAYRL